MTAQPAPDLGADGPAARARLTYDAQYRGRIVARAVASDPLDHYALAAQITERQHEAGMRLRAALGGSWPAARVTAKASYASDAGLDDDHDERPTEEEEWAAQKRHWQDQKDAERHCGSAWLTVRDVCAGAWATSCGGIPLLRDGLERLADGWGMVRR